MSKYKLPELKLDKIPTINKEEYCNNFDNCMFAADELLKHPRLYAKKFETGTKRIKAYKNCLVNYAVYLATSTNRKFVYLSIAEKLNKELTNTLNNWPYISEGKHI